ncbi:DNA primase, catalytic core [[Clostridium] aminophilum]|uniref:DNA primase n=2 Tax=[Clostridium] aminophilum TaxID=1526 RepID=A0A1I0IIS8_9FIRM|nr:DNA primase [[Clostridium] aminophilum]SET96848.1 DNA primase, catalytic core [[Clostridium] aminophilum]
MTEGDDSSMYYPDEVIEEVRSRNDIVDVISGYIKLKKSGANYFGLCPFHGEKSPSFSVSPTKQMYHCFGCGVSGNVITFVMKYENFTFREALEMLADRGGVTLPKMQYSRQQKEQQDLKNTILEINKTAANYFYHQLKAPQGKRGLDYFAGRQLSDETIRHFGLGYSNKTSNDLYQYLKSKGYSDSVLKETGLVSYKERGVYDKFWDRVMFPIMDANNRVIGFGGRVMGDGEPKYLNSPETKVFEKNRNLYGLNYARTTRKKYMLLCEGYMDVISMHQAGFTNAVASLGTALTENHAKILKRYTDTVILTYDSDGAGTKAALRAIPMLREVGITTKVLNMKPYKDPDEFIKAEGAEAFEARIEEARNSFYFEIDVLKRDLDMSDPDQKTEFYNKTARKLLVFEEALERDNYTEAVAREFMIPQDKLRGLVNQLAMKYGTGPESQEGYFRSRTEPKKDAYGFQTPQSAKSTGRNQEETRAGSNGPNTQNYEENSFMPDSFVPDGFRPEDYASDPDDFGGYVPDEDADAGENADPDRFRRPENRERRTPGPARSAPKRRSESEEGLRQSERLLLTWLIEKPALFEKLSGIIGPEDFVEPLYRRAAEDVFREHENTPDGSVNPAKILNHFIDDAGSQEEVAKLFNCDIAESLENEAQKKAFSETVLRIKKNSIEHQLASCTDIAKMQELIHAQQDLTNLRVTMD